MHKNYLKKYYFIEKFEKSNIDVQKKNTVIIYRNYSKIPVDENLIIKIRDFCKKNRKKLYLSNNIKLAIKLNLDGAYIPSFNKSTKHLAYSFKKNFKILGSAHNLKEIRTKEIQNVSKIFLSSLFKKNKNYLGLNKFRLLSKLTNKKVIALGGISVRNFKKLSLVKCEGFAGISFFQKKTAPEKGPLNN